MKQGLQPKLKLKKINILNMLDVEKSMVAHLRVKVMRSLMKRELPYPHLL